jgi:hypothetical protein
VEHTLDLYRSDSHLSPLRTNDPGESVAQSRRHA